MNITPDYKNRNDEFDDDIIRYYENIDDNGYFYELYVIADGIKSAIVVTDYGVSIEFRSGEKEGSVMNTEIVPKRLFPDKKKLSWNDLEQIIKIIENNKNICIN